MSKKGAPSNYPKQSPKGGQQHPNPPRAPIKHRGAVERRAAIFPPTEKRPVTNGEV